MGRGRGQQIMCTQRTSRAREVPSPLRLRSRARLRALEALGFFNALSCKLGIILKHSATKHTCINYTPFKKSNATRLWSIIFLLSWIHCAEILRKYRKILAQWMGSGYAWYTLTKGTPKTWQSMHFPYNPINFATFPFWHCPQFTHPARAPVKQS